MATLPAGSPGMIVGRVSCLPRSDMIVDVLEQALQHTAPIARCLVPGCNGP